MLKMELFSPITGLLERSTEFFAEEGNFRLRIGLNA